MARPSILLILAGGAALLIILVVLYQSTRSEALPIERGTPAPQARRPAEPTIGPTAPSSTTPAAPAPIAVKPAPAPDRWAPAAPALPVAPIMPDTGEGSSNEGLHFGVQQHHAQIAAVEPQVKECV